MVITPVGEFGGAASASAAAPEEQKARILELNAKVSALLDAEVGSDDGSMSPGPTEAYVLRG